MECEYLPTGQKILFFGMDDPGKLKSLKMPFGYVGLVWFEELDQFTPEEVRSVEQSVFRGCEFTLSMKSFNPPPDPGHWVNALEDRKGRHRHHSTYLQLPEGWLGSRFLGDAELLRQEDPVRYRHEYLGEAVGVGDLVFTNLRLQAIDPTAFDRTVSGVDWGWWPDPWAFNRVCYDSRSRILYIFDEATR
ncbi:MAG: phage terminase large subunit, partial [Spirochaetaceae bacterium]|nr:phage terminase large subunit [Spirochaetaceae bacterium]